VKIRRPDRTAGLKKKKKEEKVTHLLRYSENCINFFFRFLIKHDSNFIFE